MKVLLRPICWMIGHNWRYSSGLYPCNGYRKPIRHARSCRRCGDWRLLPLMDVVEQLTDLEP